jgi:hypothetical protein
VLAVLNFLLEFTTAHIEKELRTAEPPPKDPTSDEDINEAEFLIMAVDIEYQQ